MSGNYGEESDAEPLRLLTERLAYQRAHNMTLRTALRAAAKRLAYTERLGALGWGEWNLTDGTIVWSHNLSRILERDPGDTIAVADLSALVLAEDRPIFEQGMAAIIEHHHADMTFRVRLPTGIKHLRAIAEAVVDPAGTATTVYGVVQDVTATERGHNELASLRVGVAEGQRRLAAEQRVTAQLRRMILPLPQRPVQLEGLTAAVRYVPAEEVERIGGDWYMISALPDGRTLVAIGDVAGHGLAAAAGMAKLRSALIGLTAATSDPAALLGYLNQLVYDDPGQPTGTAIIGRYDPRDEIFEWSQAGHPPPVRLRPDGKVTLLPQPAGVLLGAVPTPDYQHGKTRLAHGETLVLYTDGLVERRDADIVTSMHALADVLVAETHSTLSELLDHLRPANPEDDMCVVALRTR